MRKEEMQVFVSMMNQRWPFSNGNGGSSSSSGGGGDSRSINSIHGSLNDVSATAAANKIKMSSSRTRSPLTCTTRATGINTSGSSISHDVMGQISEICDGLYLSGARAIKIVKLRELGITTIINVTIELPNLQIEKMEQIKIAIDDSPYANIACYFDKVSDKIEDVRKRGGKVLVHCMAGISRSASLCIAYLMKHNRMTLRRAYHHVKSRRAIIRPNPGFFKQLVQYETNLFGTASVKMVFNPAAGGSIPDLYETDYSNTLNFLNKYGANNHNGTGDHNRCKHMPLCSVPSSTLSATNVKVSNLGSSSPWRRCSHFH